MTPCLILLLAVTATKPGTTCLPAFWGGVLAGSSARADVEKLYESGLVVGDPGEEAIYYRDPKGVITLSFNFGTDELVSSITISEGLNPPAGHNTKELPSSSWLHTPFNFGNYGSITFGTSQEMLKDVMGPPSSSKKLSTNTQVFTYNSSCSCDLYAGISFTYKTNRLIEVTYWQEFS